MPIEVTCPSGLRGVLRGMKVKDEQLFADVKLVKSGQVLTALLDACWSQTIDPGPYGGGKVNWGSALSSDRTYAIIQLRIASYGANYEFRVTCPNPICRHHFTWQVDLSKFDVQPVQEPAKQWLRTGQPIVIETLDKRPVKCRPLTGDDETFLAALDAENESKVLTNHLARRIVEIDGKTFWSDVVPIVEDMEATVADALMDATDEIEGGVETSFDLECPHCKGLQRAILPFEASFFSSRKRFARASKTSGSK